LVNYTYPSDKEVTLRFDFHLKELLPPKITVVFPASIQYVCFQELGTVDWKNNNDIVTLIFTLQTEFLHRGQTRKDGKDLTTEEADKHWKFVQGAHKDWGYVDVVELSKKIETTEISQLREEGSVALKDENLDLCAPPYIPEPVKPKEKLVPIVKLQNNPLDDIPVHIFDDDPYAVFQENPVPIVEINEVEVEDIPIHIFDDDPFAVFDEKPIPIVDNNNEDDIPIHIFDDDPYAVFEEKPIPIIDNEEDNFPFNFFGLDEDEPQPLPLVVQNNLKKEPLVENEEEDWIGNLFGGGDEDPVAEIKLPEKSIPIVEKEEPFHFILFDEEPVPLPEEEAAAPENQDSPVVPLKMLEKKMAFEFIEEKKSEEPVQENREDLLQENIEEIVTN